MISKRLGSRSTAARMKSPRLRIFRDGLTNTLIYKPSGVPGATPQPFGNTWGVAPATTHCGCLNPFIGSFSNLGELRQLSNAIRRFDALAKNTASNGRGKRKRALRLCQLQPFVEPLDAATRINLWRPAC